MAIYTKTNEINMHVNEPDEFITSKGVLTITPEDMEFYLFYRPDAKLRDRGFHAHQYWEIHFFCRNAEENFHFEERDYSVKPGDLFVIPPEIYHNSAPVSFAKSYSSYMIGISEKLLKRMVSLDEEIGKIFDYCAQTKNYQVRLNNTESDQQLLNCLNNLYVEYDRSLPCGRIQRLAYLSIFLSTLNRLAFSSGKEQITSGRRSIQLEELVEYVQKNYHRNITLQSTAETFFLSPATIEKLFMKRQGRSFYRYVNEYRIEMAKDRIREGHPLNQVAQSCGFTDYSNFYRAFQKATGLSPRQFAREAPPKSTHRPMELDR